MLDIIKENVQNKVPCKTNKAKKKKVHLLSKKTIFTPLDNATKASTSLEGEKKKRREIRVTKNALREFNANKGEACKYERQTTKEQHNA